MKKGISLIEVLLSVSFAAIVILAVASLLRLNTRLTWGHRSEIEIQGGLRAVSTTINNSVRNASAIFIIPGSSFQSGQRDNGWSYIGIRPVTVNGVTGNELVFSEWVPDPSHPAGGTRNEFVIVGADQFSDFELEFSLGGSDNMLNFLLSGTDPMLNDAERGRIEADVRALGAQAIVDMTATHGGQPTAIAFRSGWDYDQEVETGSNIAMIVDRSTSMRWCMTDNITVDFDRSRMFYLKQNVNILLDAIEGREHVQLTVTAFSDMASCAYIRSLWNPASSRRWNMNDPAHMNSLRVLFNPDVPSAGAEGAILVDGQTNTGSGARMSLGSSNLMYVLNRPDARNFLIVLIDGDSNLVETRHEHNPLGITDGHEYARFHFRNYRQWGNLDEAFFVLIGPQASRERLEQLQQETGAPGQLFEARDVAQLEAAFQAITHSITRTTRVPITAPNL